MSDQQYTVYIIDDDDAVRDALRMLVESVGLSARCFMSARDFLDAYTEAFSGCLVLDIRMPGISGLQLQEIMEQRKIPLPIIFITGHGDIPMAVKAVKAGAVDFISKPFRDQELLDCINRALAQYSSLQERLTRHKEIARRVATLTPREHDVLTLVIQGQANKAIAAQLRLSQRTVEVHRANMLEKMQTRSVAELVKQMSALED